MYRYPYGDTQQLNLNWFLDEFRNLKAAWEQEKAGIDGALDAEIAKAEAALADVFAARDAAAASASSAAQSAQEAGGYLDTVEADATAARNAASNANRDANAANGSAQNAAQSAINASGSAQNAAQSAINALNAQNAAGNSATAASGSASAAADSATAASGSASDAADSATAAAGSAEEAETAAGSVSESAAQIAQNADDIADLKNASSAGNYLSIGNAVFKSAGSKEIDTGNYRSVLEILGNWHRVKPAPDIETPSENFRSSYYCPYNIAIASQNADTMRDELISKNAFIVIPDNVISISLEIECFKRSVGTSFSQLTIFTEENEIVDKVYGITIGNAPANTPNYYNKFIVNLTRANVEDIFTKKKFFMYMSRQFPFYDCEYCIKMTFNISTTLTTTNAIALALEKE